MIFPQQVDTAAQQTAATLPLYRDWAYDFERDRLKLKGGRTYLIEGAEALKVWIYKALRTKRYAHAAYSLCYGHSFARIRGETNFDVVQQALRRLITEALTVSPYITGVDGFYFERLDEGVRAHCHVHTVYGDIPITSEVTV